jgi:hypothetical protein
VDKRVLAAAVLVATFGLGAGTVFVADKISWDKDFALRIAEKDRLLAGLQADLGSLRSELGSLQATNAAMRGLIDASLKDSAEVAQSNRSSVEKLRAVIAKIEALQKALAHE